MPERPRTKYGDTGFEFEIAGITWTVDYIYGLNSNGEVWGYLDNHMAVLDIRPADKNMKQDTAEVSYGKLSAWFSDTEQIEDAGLRGMAEAMLSARYQADKIVEQAERERLAAKAAQREQALNYVAEKL